MLQRALTGLVTLLCAWLAGRGASLADDNANPWRVPGDVSELQHACADRRGLQTFAQSGYLGIECGYQAVLLGSQLPVAPAPHVPWAKPYARGPLKLLIITAFGNAGADVAQLAQVTRALDAEVHWLLVADLAVTGQSTADELYRTQYLPAQARALLSQHYDAIVMTFGTFTPQHGVAPAHAYFPDDVYHAILEQVQRGTGLVLVGQSAGGYWAERTPLSAALPAHMTGAHQRIERRGRLEPAPNTWTFAGLSADTPWLSASQPLFVYGWQLQPDARVLARIAGQPAIMLREHGRGRVLLLGWDGTLGPQRYGGRSELEHDVAIAARAITYAARMEPELRWSSSSPPLAAGQPGTLKLSLSADAQVELTLRDDTYRPLHVLRVQARKGDSSIRLPSLAKGEYTLQVSARDAQGRVSGWGDQSLAVQSKDDLTVRTDREIYQVGDTVQVSARSTLTPEAELQARWEVRDAAGRVLVRQTGAFTGSAQLAYPIRDARVAPHKVQLEIARAGAPLLRAAAQFFVPSSTWDDYENVLWPMRPESELNARMRDEGGFTAVFDSFGHDDAGRIAAHHGLRVARLNDAGLEPSTVQTQPRLAETGASDSLQRAIAAAKHYGALFWLLQDERHQASDPGMPDAEGLSRYRSYLRAHYSNLDALNASWGTHLSSWEQIRPTLSSDVQAGVKNLAPWVDFRLYVADQAFTVDAQHARTVRAALGPDTPVGIDGFTSTREALPYAALDYGRLAAEGVFSFYAPYSDDLLIASMVQGPKAKYLGWAMPRKEYFGAPWRDVFRGHRGSLRFFGPTFWSDFGFLQPAGRWTGESTRELREGVGKLLIGSTRTLSPVVVLYSYGSLLTSSGPWEARHGGPQLMAAAADSRNVLEQMLVGAGVSFGYQTEAQLAHGGLAGKKLLILPRQMSVALSGATVQAIEQFVREGGSVLADLTPALCDEHGKPRARGALDALFGVRSAAEQIAQGAREYGAGVLAAQTDLPREWLIDEWHDTRLQASEGQAAGKHVADGAPAFVVKRTGRGRTLLLNLLLSSRTTSGANPGPEQHALMRAVLERAGVTPIARVVDAAGVAQTHCELNQLRDGSNLYVGVYAQHEPDAAPADVRLRFDEDRETYDVRAGRYLGRTRELPLPLHEREAALFARLDYKLQSLELAAPSAAVRGEPLRVEIRLNASAAPGRHVVHLQLTAANGVALPLYTENVVVTGGRGQLLVMPALNDPRGPWHIEAREVVSGLRATRDIQLR